MTTKHERLIELHSIAISYRGQVLEKMSILEKFLDTYIANYLTNNDKIKVEEMQVLVLGDNRILLDNKRSIFKQIAEKKDIEWYKAYNSIRKIKLKKDSVALNRDLQYVIEQRNIFAHCITNTTDEALKRKKEIGFLKFKDEGTCIWYDVNVLHELLQVIDNLTMYFLEKNKNNERTSPPDYLV